LAKSAKSSRLSGFTLLEVLIALAIMTVVLTSIFLIQQSSIEATIRAQQMNTVAMLAKNLMIDTELAFQEKAFTDLKDEERGQFPAPHQDYSWERKIKEVKFPNLGLSAGSGDGEDSNAENPQAEMLAKLVSNFLSKSLREVSVTISWRKGSGTQSYAVATYWVDLNHAFSITE
jgi:type II secretion system protein I